MAEPTPPSLTHQDPSPALVRALRQLLRPLVRLLLANRVTYPVLAKLLKSVYVEVADRDFALEGKSQTISRLSLLTDIHRKDVKRLREASLEPDQVPRSVSLGAQLVARWIGMALYLDADGNPRSLARLESDGAGPSFETLVSSVSKDIRSRAVLDEWLRLGIVEIDDADRIRLRHEAFIPDEGFEEKAYYFGRNLRDHIATAARNLSGEAPSLLERSVYYGELSSEAVDGLQELATAEGMEALQKVNRRALALKEEAADVPAAGERMTFGVYFYRTPAEVEPEVDDDE